jgi:hypothetical protein
MKKYIILILVFIVGYCNAQNKVVGNALTNQTKIIPLTTNEIAAKKSYDSITAIYYKAHHKTDSLINNNQKRQINASNALAYFKSKVSIKAYEIVLNDISPYINAYVNGSDRIISWLKGENSSTYGNFTTTGYPTKNYYNELYANDLVNILIIH